jgi:hypothetical protein
MKKAAVGLVAALGLFAPLSGAGIIYVDDDAPVGGNGQSWTTAFAFLQDALAVAQASDEIRVAGGVYYPDRDAAHPNGTGDRAATFALLSGVTVNGGYAGLTDPNDPDRRDLVLYASVLSGDLPGPPYYGSYSVVSAGSITASSVSGVRVRGGSGMGQGGGAVRSTNAQLTLSDCVFHWNSLFCEATAVYSVSGQLNLVRCEICDNDGPGVRSDGGSLTAINCSIHNNSSCFDRPGGGVQLMGGSATLVDCDISGNQGWNYAGGLYCGNAGTTVTRCTFQGNFCDWGDDAERQLSAPAGSDLLAHTGTSEGGAIYACGNVTVTDSTFIGNGASYGGALKGVESITNCIFEGNTAGAGGAILLGAVPHGRGRAEIGNCRFTDNSAMAQAPGFGGGAIYYGLYNGSAIVANCEFESNHAPLGSAIYGSWGWDSTIINCLFRGNSGTQGTIYANYASVSNCSFAGNSATTGRAIRGDGYTQVTNCILWDGGEEISYEYSSPSVTFSDVYGGWFGTGNIDAYPQFRDQAHGNLRLRFGSPCIDAGNNSACSSDYDLAGNPRRVDDPNTPDTGAGTPPLVDMGAYERMPLGDLNCDGVIDADDVDAFVAALSDTAAYSSAYPNCDWLYADCNNDGGVDFDDIDPFVALLSTP